MTDLDALRAAVVAHPAEDTPRLIYADELDAVGGKANRARAKLIRLMVQREREGPAATREQKAADAWIAKMFRRNWRSYLSIPVPSIAPSQRTYWDRETNAPPVELPASTSSDVPCVLSMFDTEPFADASNNPAWSFPNECVWRFRRGFFSDVECHWQHWMRVGDDLVRNEPIERVHLTTWRLADLSFDEAEYIVSLPGFPFTLTMREAVSVIGSADKILQDSELVKAFCMRRWPTVAEWSMPTEYPQVPEVVDHFDHPEPESPADCIPCGDGFVPLAGWTVTRYRADRNTSRPIEHPAFIPRFSLSLTYSPRSEGPTPPRERAEFGPVDAILDDESRREATVSRAVVTAVSWDYNRGTVTIQAIASGDVTLRY